MRTGVAVTTGVPLHMICTFRIEGKIKTEEAVWIGGKAKNNRVVRMSTRVSDAFLVHGRESGFRIHLVPLDTVDLSIKNGEIGCQGRSATRNCWA